MSPWNVGKYQRRFGIVLLSFLLNWLHLRGRPNRPRGVARLDVLDQSLDASLDHGASGFADLAAGGEEVAKLLRFELRCLRGLRPALDLQERFEHEQEAARLRVSERVVVGGVPDHTHDLRTPGIRNATPRALDRGHVDHVRAGVVGVDNVADHATLRIAVLFERREVVEALGLRALELVADLAETGGLGELVHARAFERRAHRLREVVDHFVERSGRRRTRLGRLRLVVHGCRTYATMKYAVKPSAVHPRPARATSAAACRSPRFRGPQRRSASWSCRGCARIAPRSS